MLIGQQPIKTCHCCDFRPRAGFTLVELVLYISLFSIMAAVIGGFFFAITEARVKSQTIAEVEQQGFQAMQEITQTTRNATGVADPAIGSSGPSLTLTVPDSGKSPTVYDVTSGALQVQEGAGLPVALTSSRVVVSGAVFENVSPDPVTPAIRVTFQVSYQNTAGTNAYEYSQTFFGSAEVRR